ncbi:peptidoglycan DD-metalloendopeptidase family protein [Thermanaerosceptrum fracticalcis]|uniref:Peptidoglycan DD-metalloendopeptidase family protein n=1 Tax=Thermanaerosceptrum fracticalcis TaxID=1712410 RepID=A0A7G6E4N3_THEFR|nr:M23 family metallopeptidase [Thermanaerosceptrum fracticalcis]QNB47037.1 peptidoglycan DD-metalloendopeptidase family protein [Thermanaerosceptrum fracticalcis]
MIREKFSKLLDGQSKQLKTLGIYTGVVLLIFSIIIPFMGKGLFVKETAKKNESPLTSVMGQANSMKEERSTVTGIVLQESQDKPKTMPAPPKAKEEAEVKAPVQTQTREVNAVSNIKDITWPVKGEVIQEVGLSYSKTFSDYRYHNGIDIKVKRGTEAGAALEGKIGKVETTKSEGLKVSIDHGDGWQSVYAHLEDVFVKTGDVVKKGQSIGIVGQPGLNEVMEGPHLHYSLLKDGKVVNPRDYLPKGEP